MRPVVQVPKPDSYPFDVSVHDESDLEADLHRQDLDFPRSPNVEAAFGHRNPSLYELLQGMLDLYEGQGTDALNDAKGTIENRLSQEYKKAGPGLADAYGKFCNYCDQYLPAEVAIEHTIPKSPYPWFTLCWDNFLLACKSCNSNKASKPPRDEVQGWLAVGDDHEFDRYQAIRAHYQWPNKGGTSYRTLVPALYINDGGWEEAADDQAVRTDLVVVSADLPTRTVMVGAAGGAAYEVQVRVKPQTDEARAVVGLCGLEKDGTEGEGIADTRTFNRTLTWFRVLTVLAPLTRDDWRDLFPIVWPGIIAVAPAIGFFSVWVRILVLLGAQHHEDPSKPGRSVLDAFLQDSGFPNTDLTSIP
jgi:hypothetical protein